MNKIVTKNKNSDKKKRKKNGFTLVELLAVLGILSIILLIGVPVFLNLQDSVLKSEKENIISYIETRAADYANDTSITVVSVEDLIKEGYVEPDDETDIYDPVTNESFNCYIVTSIFENGAYESTMSEESLGTDESGICNSYQKELDLAICEYNADETDCTLIDNNSWSKEDMKLGVRYRTGDKEILKSDDGTYDWLGSDGSTSNEYYINTSTNLISQNVYRVIVTMEDGVSEATQAINIDKYPPEVVNYSVNPDSTTWSKSKEVTVEVTDIGSGVAGVYIGEATECTEDLSYSSDNIENNIYKETFKKSGTFNVCVKDKAGNVSNEPHQIVVDYVDGNGAETISLTASTSGYAQNITLIGKAQDTESGLVAYQFTQSATEPTSGWIEINQTNNEIIQYKEGITSNGTWYFWVKDAVGNTNSANYTINNIDTVAPTATLTPSTTSSVTSLTLNGVGIDNESGVKRYIITTSSNKPSSGWTTLSTPRQRIDTQYNVTSNGTYYLWVEDAYGNISKASYKVSNIHVGPRISRVTISNISDNGFTVNATAVKGSSALSRYYFSYNGGSTWQTVNSSSTSASYTFSGLSSDTNYSVAVKVMDTKGSYSTIYYTSARTTSSSFAEYIKSTYPSDSDLKLSGDDYYYTGNNPDNYVCFGSNASSCPEENLYRIIGVYDDKVKLVKYTLFDLRYTWAGGSNNNDWRDSPLNEYLNTTYLNSFASTWRNMIATTTWTIKDGALFDAKIGLLYKAEVELAKSWISPPYYIDIYDREVERYEHSTDGADIDAEINGEIHEEWLLDVYRSNYVYRFKENGNIYYQKRAHCVPSPTTNFCRKRYFRSTFSLVSEVKKDSGNGTINNPYRVSL